MIQEIITLVVFVQFARIFFNGESLTYNDGMAALLLVGAIYFALRENHCISSWSLSFS